MWPQFGIEDLTLLVRIYGSNINHKGPFLHLLVLQFNSAILQLHHCSVILPYSMAREPYPGVGGIDIKGFTFATHGKNLVSYNCLVAFRRLIAPGENQAAGHDDTTHKLQCMLHDIQRFVPPDTVKIRSLQKEKPGASAGLPLKSYTAQ